MSARMLCKLFSLPVAIAGLLGFLAGPLRAAPAKPSLAEILNSLEQKHRDLRTLTAEFSEGRTDPLFARSTQSEGRIYLQRGTPWLLRMEFSEPEPLLLLVRNEKVSLSRRGKRATADKGAGQILAPIAVSEYLPIAWFTTKSVRYERTRLAADADIQGFVKRAGAREITRTGIWLTMKDANLPTREPFYFHLNPKTNVPDSFLWQDALGLLHWVVFKSPKINQTLPTALFETTQIESRP